MDRLTLVLAGVNVIGAALAAGALFAFSAFVMDGLDRAGHPAGMAAMQGINLAAPSPLFMLVLVGTAVTSLASGVLAVVRWGEPGSAWLIVGAGLYVVSLAVTIIYHVPRNDALAALDPAAPSSLDLWHRYQVGWTRMNHVRVALALAAAVAFLLALRDI